MKEKYRIIRITIKGKGSQRVNTRTDCLSYVRKELAEKYNVQLKEVLFSYKEKIKPKLSTKNQ